MFRAMAISWLYTVLLLSYSELCRGGLCCMFRAMASYSSVVMLSCPSHISGALESPDLLLLNSLIVVALHNTIILIITLTSFYIYVF